MDTSNIHIPTAPDPATGAYNHAVKALIAHAENHCLPRPHEIREVTHPSGALRIEVWFDRAPFQAWLQTVILGQESNEVVRLPGQLEPSLRSSFEVTLPDTGVELVFTGYRDLPLGVVADDLAVKAGA